MRSHRYLDFCLTTPWAMEPSAMAIYASMLSRGYARREGFFADGEIGARGGPAARPQVSNGRQGSIAVIQVFGVIAQRASNLGMCEGGTGAQEISGALQMALADDTVSQILMEFHTPGGSVYGVGELASEILAARARKPIIGLANSMCASAGYWLMSQCTEAYCTPGGEVGSIGVWQAHEDMSKALAEAGVNITLISAGKFKTEGNPYGPLGDEAKAFMQLRTDEYYAPFAKAVAKGRGVGIDAVRNGMGQGRVLGADAAAKAGMIDGVATFNDVVRKMQASPGRRPSTSRSSAGVPGVAPFASTPSLNRARRAIDLLENS